MSTEIIKQGLSENIGKLLNGAYALPIITIIGGYLWSNLTPEQIDRLRELEPLLNSSPGIAFSAILVLSYLSSVLGGPIKEMTRAVVGLQGKIDDLAETLRHRYDHTDEQIIEIKEEIKRCKKNDSYYDR